RRGPGGGDRVHARRDDGAADLDHRGRASGDRPSGDHHDRSGSAGLVRLRRAPRRVPAGRCLAAPGGRGRPRSRAPRGPRRPGPRWEVRPADLTGTGRAVPVPGAGLDPGVIAHVAVTATTLWVEPRTHRPDVDGPSLTSPVALDAWNATMQGTETRRWLTGKLESQAVLGSEVIVDEIDGDWARIVVTARGTARDPRGYPGWVPTAHLVVDEDFAQRAPTSPTATVTALTSTLSGTRSGNHPGIDVSFDTILPVLGRTATAVRVAVPGPRPAPLPAEDVVVHEAGETPPLPAAEDVIATGERFLGLRYLWAGVSAYGVDCSGYTYTLFHHHGISIDRDAGDQMHHSGLEPVERE